MHGILKPVPFPYTRVDRQNHSKNFKNSKSVYNKLHQTWVVKQVTSAWSQTWYMNKVKDSKTASS